MSFRLLNRFHSHSIFSTAGRAYEKKCKEVLSEAFDTKVELVGGANDGGIDLIWNKTVSTKSANSNNSSNTSDTYTNNTSNNTVYTTNDTNTSIPFIGQCKFKSSSKVGPSVIRELEGTLSSASPGTIGCLISNHRPSQAALNCLKYSKYPLMYLLINEFEACRSIHEIALNRVLEGLYKNNFKVITGRYLTGSFTKFHW